MKFIYLLWATFFINPFVQAQNFTPVEEGSKIRFVIKNFGIKTAGDFSGLKGTITFNPKDLATSNFNVTVQSSTINTNNGARDKHLRKSEYFNVEKFPQITITSTKISESTIAGRYFFAGNLTLKGVTKPIQFGFTAVAEKGAYIFSGEFELNRRDFGVGGNSISLGDKVKVTLLVNTK